MSERPWVSVQRARVVSIDVPKLAATIHVRSIEDYKCRGWGTPTATIEGPAPGAFTVSAGGVEALHEGLLAAFAAFEKEFGA